MEPKFEVEDAKELENVKGRSDRIPRDRAAITCQFWQTAFHSETRMSQNSKYFQPASIDTDEGTKTNAVRRELEQLQSKDIDISALRKDGIVKNSKQCEKKYPK